MENTGKQRVKIFVDDEADKFLSKTAVEKYDWWQEYEREGRSANIVDVRIFQDEGTPMKIVVTYTT